MKNPKLVFLGVSLNVGLLMAFGVEGAGTDNLHKIEPRLKSIYLGQPVILRSLCCGEEIEFSPDGQLIKATRKTKASSDRSEGKGARIVPAVSWTVCGWVLPREIRFTETNLEIKAERMLYKYNPDRQGFEQYLLEKAPDTLIQIKDIPAGFSEESALHLLQQIFTLETKQLRALVPEYWKSWFTEDGTIRPPAPPANSKTCCGVDKVTHDLNSAGVTSPRVLFRAEPVYSEEARSAKLQGHFAAILLVDETGKGKVTDVVRPLGGGLDEAAVESLLQWKFAPAEREGKPVAVSLKVEVNFRLGRNSQPNDNTR